MEQPDLDFDKPNNHDSSIKPRSSEAADAHVREYVKKYPEKIIAAAMALKEERGLESVTEALNIYLNEHDWKQYVDDKYHFDLISKMQRAYKSNENGKASGSEDENNASNGELVEHSARTGPINRADALAQWERLHDK